MDTEQYHIDNDTGTAATFEKFKGYFIIKRLIDILGLLFIIILLSPIMIIKAAAVIINSGGRYSLFKIEKDRMEIFKTHLNVSL